jgi:hypothetical protein
MGSEILDKRFCNLGGQFMKENYYQKASLSKVSALHLRYRTAVFLNISPLI